MDGYCPRCYTKRSFMEDVLRDFQSLGLASLIDGWRNACEGRGSRLQKGMISRRSGLCM
ncbi:MAG: hypothetical protein ISN26_06615 [Betaproteobacteria bacterium AqS2]|uniref:Uncharacterized protein n=1 Tax=Candidatus Amphirhobacter heronislandensis TaxID=1732024 RepID=A0A930UIJ4_9GAMM|nr:hypothetical protein [Betaproteobacteria bacterium AqS2]